MITVGRRRPNLNYLPYVQDYLDRVTAADVAAGNTSGLELGVTNGISTFLQDFVSVSYFGVSGNVISQAASTIKVFSILGGARTLAGSFVPIVGPAPINNNFNSSDYNRKVGLTGRPAGSTYLDSSYSVNADPQNDHHLAFYRTRNSSATTILGGARTSGNVTGGKYITYASTTQAGFASVPNGDFDQSGIMGNIGTTELLGFSRSAAGSYTSRSNRTSTNRTQTSTTPINRNIWMFGLNNGGTLQAPSSETIKAYSIGRALDLSILEARLDTLYAAFAATIP